MRCRIRCWNCITRAEQSSPPTNDWQETQNDQIAASGLAPNDSRESAIFATLTAGNYTVVGGSAADTTGVAWVEICSVQE